MATTVVYSNYNGADISCFGANDGASRVTATGGTGAYTYQWDAATNNQTTRTATNLGPGAYTVIVSDVNNCTATSTVTLTEPDQLLVDVFTTTVNGYNISCFGGNNGVAGSNVTGGTPNYTYSWNDPSNQNTTYAMDLVAGNYTLRVSDANGCTATDNITLLEPPLLTVTANATSNYNGFNVSCFAASDGSAIANPAGGVPPYTYLWNDPNIQLTQTATALAANIPYTVFVSDDNECVVGATVTLTQPTAVTTQTSVISNYHGREISCFNGTDGAASVLAGGGAPPYTFQWSSNAGGIVAAVATGLAEGTYQVTVTDANNCPKVDSVSLVQPPLLEAVTANLRDASCFGDDDGQANVTASGGTAGYTYQWDFYAGTQITATANNLAAGTYSVTVTDINLCEQVSTVTVNEPTELVSSIAKTDVLCFGNADGVATVTPTGGTPNYVYNWSTPTSQTAASANNLAPGIYEVTITDNNGCTATNNIEIAQPTQMTVVFSKTDPTCYGYTDGTATVTVNGGIPTYIYKWNTLDGTDQATDLGSGIYVMDAYDANGCLISDTIELFDPPTTGIAVVPDSSLIPLGGSVRLSTVITTSASNSVSYVWSPAEGLSCDNCANPVANPLFNTVYTVEMTDGDGCKTSTEVVVDVNDKHKLYYIPNAFSPNNDGLNDVFYVYGKAVSNMTLVIYDRWGEKMFESKDLSFGWNGVHKGELMPSGVFVYYAEIYFENGDRVEEKGSITLLR